MLLFEQVRKSDVIIRSIIFQNVDDRVSDKGWRGPNLKSTLDSPMYSKCVETGIYIIIVIYKEYKYIHYITRLNSFFGSHKLSIHIHTFYV